MSDEQSPSERLLEDEDDRPEARLLFDNLKRELLQLAALRDETNGHWNYEDGVYRFYHGSFKVYGLQDQTEKIVEALKRLQPDCELDAHFAEIIRQGTSQQYEKGDADTHFLRKTRLVLEAFFHAKYFLEMAVKYGEELAYPPRLLPSGWAALLYLYHLR